MKNIVLCFAVMALGSPLEATDNFLGGWRPTSRNLQMGYYVARNTPYSYTVSPVVVTTPQYTVIPTVPRVIYRQPTQRVYRVPMRFAPQGALCVGGT